jgi:hypothetical protein
MNTCHNKDIVSRVTRPTQPDLLERLTGSRCGILGSALAILLCSLASVQAAAAEDVIPKSFSAERYQSIWARNPFEWVTPTTVAVDPNFTEKLVLTSWLNQGDSEVVLVQNKETQVSEKVTREPNANQLRIVSIRGDIDPKNVTVVLSNGKEEGSVRFNTEPPKVADAGNPAPQRSAEQGARFDARTGQKNSRRGVDNPHQYTMPPGMNQYNQHHYGAYIQQQLELKKQQQQIQQQQQQHYKQTAQQANTGTS